MSHVYFNSDLHLGHKRVIEFHENFRAKCMGVSSIKEHDEMIFDLWGQTVNKKDTIYILGDIGYNYQPISKLPGHKKLVLGNHDTKHAHEYLEIFDDIIGAIRYKQFWINHFPIHPSELYGKKVIHGHTHSTGVAEENYINVCVEFTRGKPISFLDIRSGLYKTHDKVNKKFEEIYWG